MTGRRLRVAALAAAVLLFLAAGCGRKAKPEPRSASRSGTDIITTASFEERTCTISR